MMLDLEQCKAEISSKHVFKATVCLRSTRKDTRFQQTTAFALSTSEQNNCVNTQFAAIWQSNLLHALMTPGVIKRQVSVVVGVWETVCQGTGST